MFFLSAYFLSTSTKADKSKYLYIAYSGTLLILITIAMSCNLFFGIFTSTTPEFSFI